MFLSKTQDSTNASSFILIIPYLIPLTGISVSNVKGTIMKKFKVSLNRASVLILFEYTLYICIHRKYSSSVQINYLYEFF